MKKLTKLVTLLLAAVFALAACGNNNSNENDSDVNNNNYIISIGTNADDVDIFIDTRLIGTWLPIGTSEGDISYMYLYFIFHADGSGEQGVMGLEWARSEFEWHIADDGRMLFFGEIAEYHVHDGRLSIYMADWSIEFAAQTLDDTLVGIWRVTEMTGRTQADLVMNSIDFMFFADGSGIMRTETQYNPFYWLATIADTILLADINEFLFDDMNPQFEFSIQDDILTIQGNIFTITRDDIIDGIIVLRKAE